LSPIYSSHLHFSFEKMVKIGLNLKFDIVKVDIVSL